MRPSSTYSTEIRSGEVRLGLGTFDTAHEAMRQRAQELAPPPRLITDEDCHKNWRRERRLSLTEMNEQAMALWCQRFPQDVINEQQLFVERRAKREERRVE
ncbi:uncharacterized protein [Aegilops tauschii subsp. strangulata]|uniref:uncharacterized protein n=1 Tax=Aegilops tauschii subsp. strangulata TaxID=200361 RepID=UPI00098A2FF6|nr:uncharacterized protein LOC109737805 [Aegilops tauschii subsp. strangulata]